MNIKTLFLATAAAMMVTSVAQAGYYVGADAGIALPKKEKFNEGGYKVTYQMEDGFVGDLIGGYDFGNNFRTELDLGFRHYSMDKVAGVRTGGKLNSYALTGNVFYDFNNSTRLTPFLGLGAGIARNKMKVSDASLVNPALSGSKNGSSTKFAAQGTAGVAFKVTDAISASLAYRYFTTLSQRFQGAKYDLISHEVLLGLRYEFGACKKGANGDASESAVPVVAAVAPAVAAAVESNKFAITPAEVWDAYAPIDDSKEYTVYFRNDSVFLNNSDKKVLSDVVATYKELGEGVKVKLDGSADAVGTKAYNLGLSQRRALVTEKALSDMGVDAGEILTHGSGIIGTKPNPQNRRVDITFAK